MSERHSKDLAIVLRVYPSRESDLVVRLLTQHSGKLSALARGARRSKRRFLSGIDVFDRGVVEMSRGKGAMLTLESMTAQGGYRRIREQFDILSCSSLIVEAYDQLIAEEDTTDCNLLFESLDQALNEMNESSASTLVPTTVNALQNLLELSGYHLRAATAKHVGIKELRSFIHQIEELTTRKLNTAEGLMPLLAQSC